MTPIPAKSQVLLHDLEFHLLHLFGQAAQADAMPEQGGKNYRERQQAEEKSLQHPGGHIEATLGGGRGRADQRRVDGAE